MTKSEIKKVTNNELIREYVNSYALLMCNENLGRGTTQLSRHCADLEAELLKRDILTQEDIRKLNM